MVKKNLPVERASSPAQDPSVEQSPASTSSMIYAFSITQRFCTWTQFIFHTLKYELWLLAFAAPEVNFSTALKSLDKRLKFLSVSDEWEKNVKFDLKFYWTVEILRTKKLGPYS